MTASPTTGPQGPPTTRPLDGSGVAAVEPELLALYSVCYADPPWSEGPDEVTAYRLRLASWAAEPTFAGLIARDDAGTLVGAVYGWSGAPALRGTPLPGIDDDTVFHVGDLMVAPAARRSGLGRRLLDQLVERRRPAVLVTHPDSSAWRLYQAGGWERTGLVAPPGIHPLLTYVLR